MADLELLAGKITEAVARLDEMEKSQAIAVRSFFQAIAIGAYAFLLPAEV